MPVLTMQESNWDDTRIMLANGEDMINARQSATNGPVRSQDDARVSYFSRSQGDVTQQYGLHQALTVSEIEREFHRLAFENSGDKDSRNLWDSDKGGGGGDGPKGMYVPLGGSNPWMTREDNWGAPNTTDSLTDLMQATRRRPGSFPGTSELPPVMSPQSADTTNLGINMAEYVLGNSPLGKDLENRLQGIHRFVGGGDAENPKLPVEKSALIFDVDVKQDQEQDSLHINGTLQNGLEEKGFSRAPGSRQNSPTSADTTSLPSQLKQQQLSSTITDNLLQSCQPQCLPLLGGMAMNHLSLDMPPLSYDMMGGYDPFQTNYANHLMAPPPIHAPPPMDSPNFSIDYNQQMIEARQQQQQQSQLALMPPQRYALPTDQLLGPAVMPQYYGVTPPWPMFQTGPILQQQQQQSSIASGNPQPPHMRNQNPRSLTPQQTLHDAMPMQTQGAATPSYQILATPAYYDQSGQILMSGGRPLVRLVSPGPLLMNAASGQQGYNNSGNMYTPVSGSLFNPRSNTPSVWLNSQQSGYSGAPLGSSISQGSLQHLPLQQQHQQQQQPLQRRDSLGSQEFKQLPLANFSHFYSTSMSPAGTVGLLPAATANTMTPPPSLASSVPLSGLGLTTSGRVYAAAPGSEAKFRSGSAGSSNALFGTSLFSVQQYVKSELMSKEGAGRSQLLEDFRSNRIPNLQLRDLTNHVVEFSQDQHGSRFIQQKLEHATAAEKSMVFSEILTSAYSLMTDVFGNYVIQKFFEFGSQEQKQTLAQRVRGHVLTLALHMYGCRVIQKALESIAADLQVEVVKELDGHVLKCVKDQNGNHVVQKCIESIDPKHLGFITDAFKGQVLNLAMHPYGCRVIQRILEHCTPEQVKPIMDELLQHTEHLVHDQYGNYVIQHVLEHGAAEDKTKIISRLRGKMMVLSQHKFASNVVEKCVSHSSRAERASIIEEVCTMNDGPQSALYTMMKDQFANYVVQKMIDLADPPQRKLLLQKIRPHVTILRRYAYGKHILAKLEKFYMKNNADLGPIGVVPSSTVQ